MNEDFNPKELIPLAKEQYPQKEWLVDALENLGERVKTTAAMVYYVNPKSEDWRFKINLELEDTPYGLVIIDVLEENKIGAFELFDRIPYK